uniref:Uncharacterized protein n=1 Tax=Triticum urartu TaxID=4572 RepID=A0A8R7V1D3_TRIUA
MAGKPSPRSRFILCACHVSSAVSPHADGLGRTHRMRPSLPQRRSSPASPCLLSVDINARKPSFKKTVCHVQVPNVLNLCMFRFNSEFENQVLTVSRSTVKRAFRYT